MNRPRHTGNARQLIYCGNGIGFGTRPLGGASTAVLSLAVLMFVLVARAQSQDGSAPAPALPPEATATGNAVIVAIPLETIIAALIENLDDPQYHTRERSTKALQALGQSAKAALEIAAQNDSPEVRLRAQPLLRDLRLGISAEWPSELALLARHFDRLNDDEQTSAVARIANTLQHHSAAFLVSLTDGQPDVVTRVVRRVAMTRDPQFAQALIEAIGPDPTNELQKALLANAKNHAATPLDPALILDDLSVHLEITLTETIKEQPLATFQQAISDVSHRVILTIAGTCDGTGSWRFLDDPSAGLSWDAKSNKLLILINGRPIGQQMQLDRPASGDAIRVAIESADCVYLYRIDPASGETTRLQRFEKDYLLRVIAGGPLAEMTNVRAGIGSAAIAWSDISGAGAKGHLLDMISGGLTLNIEATLADGRRTAIVGTRRQMALNSAETSELPSADAEAGGEEHDAASPGDSAPKPPADAPQPAEPRQPPPAVPSPPPDVG